jgi:hypothetical protein
MQIQLTDINDVCKIISNKFVGGDVLSVAFGSLVRRSIDEVIDTDRTGRKTLAEIEKTEKTYIGTKVEILTRALLGLKKGNKLDLKIGDHEVDVKFTIGSTWMIPMEAFNELCLLIQANEKNASFGVGLLKMVPENLTSKENRDKKLSVSAHGRKNITWLAQGALVHLNQNAIEFHI